MRFLIINTDYSEFLRWLYDKTPGLRDASYQNQLQARNESLFGVADFYSSNLQKLGHEAWTVHANNEYLQKSWIDEFAPKQRQSVIEAERRRTTFLEIRKKIGSTPLKYLKRAFRPFMRAIDSRPPTWFYNILAAQIEHYRPDVVLNQDVNNIHPSFIEGIKKRVPLVVGQHGSPPINKQYDFRCYDLMISSFPPTIDYFRKCGIAAETNHLAFEATINVDRKKINEEYEISFIGNLFSGFHNGRIELLEYLCERFPNINIWAPDIEHLSSNSPIRKHYRGQAWGRDAYEILAASKITLNHHADAGPYASNMRLYEATGVGAFLITDWKENLNELFEPGKEVAVFRSKEECTEIAQYYLNNQQERETIAVAGNGRTMTDHTYYRRMQQLEEIIKRYLD